tara:strand:+ start:1904 stop:2890 length:987 start_codon:yes stop_codon:yes gene_type:complete
MYQQANQANTCIPLQNCDIKKFYKIMVDLTKMIEFRKFDTNFINTSFLPNEIMLYCSENYKYDCIIRINNKTILSIATKQKRIPSISKEMVNIILLMTNEFRHDKKLFIRYLPTPFKKVWNGIDRLSYKHVNSGLSSFNENKNDILIFREEESKKVLIHELIHALELHCVKYGTIINKNYLEHLDECIVETWATILNLAHIQFKKIPSIKDLDNLFNSRLFAQERNFCLKQAAKILKQHGCRKNGTDCIIKIPNSPSIFSYYIVKAALLSNPNKFIRQFWWPKIKKCKNIQYSSVKEYFNEPLYLEKITKYSSHKFMPSMRMTKYGDF